MTQIPISNKRSGQRTRDQIHNRYVFDGRLEMQTGLHIGGGKETLSNTNSPVVLTVDGLPFIPGSSLKGVLRSTVEKFVASLPGDLGLHSCGLPLDDVEGESCPTARQKEVAKERRENPRIIEEERARLCNTCQLFGSPFAAARIIINDLYLINDEWGGTTQIRDGVAIDRDSETAKSGFKYDFEVVPSTTVFKLHITVENATVQDLQLISIGLSEFANGFVGVGGFRSRGLGACILNDLTIRYMDVDRTKDGQEMNDEQRKKRLLRYLLGKRGEADDGLDQIDAHEFFERHINTIFQ